MPRFMKILNNISRCQAMYRKNNLSANDLCSSHYAFVLSICRLPGHPQDELAKNLCLDKSTVARTLSHLEKNEYIIRVPNEKDKRQTLVYPSEKMLSIYPIIRSINTDWNTHVTKGISPEKLNIFFEVLSEIETNAKQMIEMEELS